MEWISAIQGSGQVVIIWQDSRGAEQPSVQTENANVSTLEKVQEKAETKSIDISGYQALLKNSAGTIKKEMRLLCTGVAQAEIRDFFGEDAEYKIKENGDLMVTVQLPENSKFYGWLTGMGGDVRILKPKKSALAYRDYLKSLAKEYKGL